MSGLIFKKMSDVMKDIKAIGKDQTNSAQGFKFRGIDQFVNALYPALTKHGVFMAPKAVKYDYELRDVERKNGSKGIDKHVQLMMEYTFYAEDGSFVTIGPIAAEGLDSGDKATNKALSAALKYALIQTFCVPTEDMVDGDSDSPEHGFHSPAKQEVVKKTLEAPKPEVKVDGAIPLSKLNISEVNAGIPKAAAPVQAEAPKKAGSSFKPKTAPKPAPKTDNEGWE